MSHNPYAPPEANVTLAPIEPAIPNSVLKQIRNAWVAGAISTSITLIFTLFAIAGTSLAGYTAWQAFDVGLMISLTFGIYKKSRVCAVLMFIYFVVSKIMQVSQSGQASGLLLALVFLYYYGLGIRGTFSYHKLSKIP